MPSTGQPAGNPIPRHRVLIGSEAADVVVQTASTRAGSAAPGHGRSAAPTYRRQETFIDTAKHEPKPQGPAEPSLVPSLSEALDHQLQAVISLDPPRDTVDIDINGSLTRFTRAALLDVTTRIRELRVSSHIRVHLGSAAFVESGSLAWLRTDVLANVGRAGERAAHGRVSVETGSPRSGAASWHTLSGITLCPARLDEFTKVDLLTASDFLFAWLDDALGCPGTNVSAMLALYEHIGQEITGRTHTRPI